MNSVNNAEYWEHRFASKDWEAKGGTAQSEYFSKIAIESFPDWLKNELNKNEWAFVDYGCANGSGTAYLARHFPSCLFKGIDISESAIQVAREAYPFCQFEVGDITQGIQKSDIVFSSNTLEHFQSPLTLMKTLIAAATKFAVILLPLEDETGIEEHFSIFETGVFPSKIENHTLSFFRIIDCSKEEVVYWPGKQILLVYSNDSYKPENNGLLKDIYEYNIKGLFEEEERKDKELREFMVKIRTLEKESTEERTELNSRLEQARQRFETALVHEKQISASALSEIEKLNKKNEGLESRLFEEEERKDKERREFMVKIRTLEKENAEERTELNSRLEQEKQVSASALSEIEKLNKKNEELEFLLSEKERKSMKQQEEIEILKREAKEKEATLAGQIREVQELERRNSVLSKQLAEIPPVSVLKESLGHFRRLVELNVNEALELLYKYSAAKSFKIVHFFNRLKWQFIHGNKNERKKFIHWFFARWNRTKPIEDHRYNALYTVIEPLERIQGAEIPDFPVSDLAEQQSAEQFIPENTKDEVESIEEIFPETLSEKYVEYDILVLSIINYDFRHQRPQHLAQRFAANGHRVFYFNVDFRPEYMEETVEEGLTVITFPDDGTVSIHFTDLFDNPDTFTGYIDHVLSKNGIRDAVTIVDYPNWINIAINLRKKYGFPIITDYMDDFTGFLSPAAEMIRRNCFRLLKESDLVVASSQFLYDIAAQNSKKTVLLRNGTEFEYFHSVLDERPEEKGKKTIGYYGAVADWFAADLVCRCAQEFRDCELVIVGEVSANREKLEAEKNICLIGEVPYTALLPWLKRFDVCLIPFNTDTDLIKATNPVKFYEYLAAGKKIVATEIPELMPYRNKFAYLENDPEEFCRCVRLCLENKDTLADADECTAFAQENDWSVRAEDFLNSINVAFPLISIILLCYNQLDYTKKCIQSILDSTAYPNYELIVVDNASSDGTAEFLSELAKEEEKVRIVLNDKNKGFAGGNNCGIVVSSGEYVVLLNNDTVVTRGWLTGLVKHFHDSQKVGIVGPVTNSIGNESKININYETVEDMKHAAFQYTQRHMGETYDNFNVLAMFCVMISRELIEEIGPLDENYGIGMFEDDDYSLAARHAGYDLVLAEDVFIHHYERVSFGKMDEKTHSELFEKNRAYYEKKWNTKWKMHQFRKEIQ